MNFFYCIEHIHAYFYSKKIILSVISHEINTLKDESGLFPWEFMKLEDDLMLSKIFFKYFKNLQQLDANLLKNISFSNLGVSNTLSHKSMF